MSLFRKNYPKILDRTEITMTKGTKLKFVEVVPRQLGAGALSYLRDILCNHGKSLSISTCGLISDGSRCYSYLHESIDVEKINKYRESIYFGNSAGLEYPTNSQLVLAHLINSYLSEDINNVCVFENPILGPKDIDRHGYEGDYFFRGEEVYHFLSHADAYSDMVPLAIRETEGFWVVIVFFSKISDPKLWPNRGESISEELLTHLSNNTAKIAISAFDGEGYIFWDRDPRINV